MSEPSPIDSGIQLGENHELSREDLTRALVCSMAVYLSKAEAEIFLQKTMSEDPSITFQEVHLSMDKLMLVAYTETKKEMFIAFKGTNKESLEDVACNLRIDEKFQYEGSFHSGFSERAEVLMGSTHNPLSLLLSQPEKPRIIFCGHSLGGAVAYMALLHFLQDSHILEGSCNYHDSLFAVAFGAPHICDVKAAKAINENIDMRWRFINFVNQQDPVPRLLHHLKNSLVKVIRADLASSSGSMLKAIGGFIGKSTQGYGEGGGPLALAFSGMKAAGPGFINSFFRQHAQNALGYISDNIFPDSEGPDFYPVGQYVLLFRDTYYRRSKGVVWNFEVRDSWDRDDEFLKLLATVEITRETLAFHPIRRYKSVLIGANLLDRRAGCSKSELPPGADQVQVVSIPEPKVTKAEWRNIESFKGGEKYIYIEGENLFFLRGVAVNISGEGENDWGIIAQSDRVLRLFDPKNLKERLENPGGKNAVPFILITTAFGSAQCPILDKNSVNQTASGGAIIRMLEKIVHTLVVKASLPSGYGPSRDFLDHLDKIMQCVPHLAYQRRMSEHVREYIENCIGAADGNAEGSAAKIDEMNNMVKAVEKFLSSSLKVTYGQSDAQAYLSSAAFLSILGAAAAALASAPALVVAGCLVCITSIGGVVILGKDSVIIEGYIGVLDLAIKEALRWSGGHRDSQSGSSVEDYENELIKQVNDAGDNFNFVVNNLDGKHLKSELFQRATEYSKEEFLNRIKVARDIESLSTSMVQEHFIGIFGEEDTGKTTLIKNVLLHHSRSVEASRLKTGPDGHTKISTAYSLPGSRWIVDFPGSNGVGIYANTWEKLSASSTSAVLLLDFEFDMKREQTDQYREMKNKLQTEVSVVFNKVDQYYDQIFDNTEPSQEDYLCGLRKSHAAKLNCNKDKVHFACLDPDLPEAEFNELKRIGVVDFEGLARILGLIAF